MKMYSRRKPQSNSFGNKRVLPDPGQHFLYGYHASEGNTRQSTGLARYLSGMNNPNQIGTSKRAYQLQNIEKQQLGVRGSGNNPSLITPTTTIQTVADLFDVVKSTYRSILSTDVQNNLRNKNELGTTVGVTNNLRSLAVSIKFIDDIVAPVNDDVKQRFSYAGERAETADLDALERAKEMQAAGVADETIRQETGWFTGMDGKWRWEIDDSGMERPETVSENL